MALWLLGSATAKAQFAYMPLLENGKTSLCRLGINGGLGPYPIVPMRFGWFLDYTATEHDRAGTEYFPVVKLEQTLSGYTYSIKPNRSHTTEADLRAAVSARKGSYWIIGNEPDRKQFQDDLEPQVYATAYHDLYHIIKNQDPTAKIVAGTIVQPTEIRIDYLNLVLKNYFQLYKEAMPVDGWAFHNFILNEASCSYYEDKVPPAQLSQVCWGAEIPPGVNATDGLRIDVQDNDRFDLFTEQIVRFRQWMADHGYRNTPAFLSEFGILMPQGIFTPDFTQERVNTFMSKTFDYLLNTTDPNIGYPGDGNRLVQRFAWYSINDNINFNGFLFDPSLPIANSRTLMGDNFASIASAQTDDVDYYVDHVNLASAPPLTSQGATTITLEAVIGNSGNLASGTPAMLRFFDGPPGSGGVQIGSDQNVSLPGCGEQSTFRLNWAAVEPGTYTVYAQISTPNNNDLISNNNEGSVDVRFANQHLFLPNLKRDLGVAP